MKIDYWTYSPMDAEKNIFCRNNRFYNRFRQELGY